MNSKKRFAHFFWFAIAIIPIIGVIWSLIEPKEFVVYQSLARKWIDGFGYLGPLVFVIVQALQVIITPISHYTIGALGGYLYGPYLGGCLNYIGRVIGHLCAFEISRRFGRKFLEKHLDSSTLRRYDHLVGEASIEGRGMGLQPLILFLIYFLPFFPDDEVSYLVGVSSMKRRYFLFANLFGHLGGAFSLAYMGSGVSTKDPLFWILTILTLAGFPIIWAILRIHSKRTKSVMSNTE